MHKPGTKSARNVIRTTYAPVLVGFLFVQVTAVVAHLALRPHFETACTDLMSGGAVATTSFAVFARCTLGWRLLFRRPGILIADVTLLLTLLLLFAVNNFFHLRLGMNFGYGTAPLLYGLLFTLSSAGEEVLYRGFIQTRINRTAAGYRGISRGNAVATVLMVLTHLGFFTVMPLASAVTSLLLVLLFSLTAGYLRDKTSGLVLPILFHLLINYLHLAVQLSA